MEKLSTGLKLPKAGPIFPKDDAAPPKAVGKSKPIAAKPIEPMIKESI